MLRLSSFAFVSLLALAAGCRREPPPPPPLMPAKVKVVPAFEKQVLDFEDFTGTIEAHKRVEIQARVTGYLQHIGFTDGKPVKKDDVLFEIDPRPYQAELHKAEAQVVQATAKSKRLEGDLARAQELVRNRSISVEDFQKVSGECDEARAAVGVANASREAAKLFVDYTKVKAPIDGVVGKTHVDEGNLVKADMTILATIVNTEPAHVYFDVDERTLRRFQQLAGSGRLATKGGSHVKVRIALADDDGFPREAEVDFEDNVIDPATGTQRRRGVMPNPKGTLMPGMFVRARLLVGEPRRAVVVPEVSVGADQGQKFVYVVNDKSEVEYRKVTVGSLDKGLRVIEGGVLAGERVIVSGLQRVRPMAKVDAEFAEPRTPAEKAFEPKVVLPKN